jgi:acyl-CoA reductase-like NAD-dependent aldehyde dehydrogenase
MPRDAVLWWTVTRTAKELTVPYRSVNPATGEVLKTFTEHSDEDMMDALATADKAFVSWAARPIEDADLDHTVSMAILGRFGNNGQTCIGAKRFIVVESILDKFLPRFIAAAKALKLGDPLDESVTLGPLSSDGALQLILRQISDATSHGAKVLLGGNRARTVGAFLEPRCAYLSSQRRG